MGVPLPENLRGGGATKVVGALIAKGYLEEVDATIRNADAVWRETADGHGVTLVATDAGLAAIGIEPDDATIAPAGATDAPTEEPAADTPTETEAAPKARTLREGTEQAAMIAMLRAPGGASLDEIVGATGWQKHTVRGAMAGTLKKKLGLEVTSEKVEGRGLVYKLPADLRSTIRSVPPSFLRRRLRLSSMFFRLVESGICAIRPMPAAGPGCLQVPDRRKPQCAASSAGRPGSADTSCA